MFWKVRQIPRAAIREGSSPAMSHPEKRTLPADGAWTPVITLKAVVLPAPLGPMSPTSSPGNTDSRNPSRALSPPNARVTPSTASSGIGALPASSRARGDRPFERREEPPELAHPHDPARAEDHQEDEHERHENHPPHLERPEQFQ